MQRVYEPRHRVEAVGSNKYKRIYKKITSEGHFQPRGWLLSLRRKDFMLKRGLEMFSSVAQLCLTLCDIFGIEM